MRKILNNVGKVILSIILIIALIFIGSIVTRLFFVGSIILALVLIIFMIILMIV